LRIILDTSTLISYLLSRTKASSATGLLLRAALNSAFDLLLVEGVFEELGLKIAVRRDLASRIPTLDADQLVTLLRDIGEPVERLPEPYPKVGRDSDDYFLIAHAVFAGATHLVSWDNDLLDLDPLDDLRLVRPPQLLTILRDDGLL